MKELRAWAKQGSKDKIGEGSIEIEPWNEIEEYGVKGDISYSLVEWRFVE